MASIQYQNVQFDDISYYKTQKVKIGSRHIDAPFKAKDLSKDRSKIPVLKKIKGFAYLYKELTPARIEEYNSNQTKDDQFSYSIQTELNKAKEDEVRSTIFSFVSPKTPTNSELDFLAAYAHSKSDLVPIPYLHRKKENPLSEEEILDYATKIIAKIKARNNKPIMGLIPLGPRNVYPKLFEIYRENGIDSFYMDFNTRTPQSMSPNLHQWAILQKEADMTEKTMSFGINIHPGRGGKNKPIINAKDIVCYGYGIEGLGDKHRVFGSGEFFNRLKKNNSKPIRLFNKEDYGYHDFKDPSSVPASFAESSIDINKIRKDVLFKWKIDKLFNIEQLHNETARIKEEMNQSKKSVVHYLKKKENMDSRDLDEITHFKDSLKAQDPMADF